MIYVAFDPAELDSEDREWWEEWSGNATTATQELLARHPDATPIEFASSIWAELRQWLFVKVFHGKCAYCEGRVRPQSWGAAEHWRPKGGVTVRDEVGKLQKVERDGQRHPGYYWLAYDWRNLVPVCETCNSGKGKGTQFPVNRQHAFSPGEGATTEELNECEQPLLLHPFDGGTRDPRNHLYFDEFGIPHPRNGSEYGAASIEVFGLDREDLVDDRRRRYLEIEEHVAKAIMVAATGYKSIEEELDRHVAPQKEYSLAVRDFIALQLSQRVGALMDQALSWGRGTDVPSDS
jgi:hypothetical protein